MIKTENLCFKYSEESKKFVLNDINLQINKGDFVAVLGHNGSGKSTLAKHFNAILLPNGGKVYIEGLETNDESKLFDIRQKVGMVFQNPDNQIVATIVEDDVAFAPENLGIPTAEIRNRVNEALKAVGMSNYKKHAPHMLSGGQKQRIAIAGVLAMEPKYIVLDEPTAMLDPIGRREVMSTLLKLNKEKKITVVLITHNMDEAVMANRVIVMNKGKMVMDGTPKEIFSEVTKLKELGLDVPQVTELTHRLKAKGINLPNNILTVDEAYEALKPLIKFEVEPINEIKFNSNDNVIETKNLTYEYAVGGPYHKVAINNINIKIPRGKIVGIIGHTGSGKSTLVQHLNCLLKPTLGSVIINGTDVTQNKANLREIRNKIGVVFQYPEYQLFEETVIKDIAFGPKNMGLKEDEAVSRAVNAARSVGLLDEVFEKSPFDLSGGQKRRVAIAGILAMHPSVIVLDEPTAGLDPKGREEILGQIKKLHEDLDITIVLVSHGMEDIANTVDELYVLNEGEIKMHGTPTEVYANYEELEKISLSSPQVTKLTDMLTNLKVCTVDKAFEVLSKAILKE